LDYKKAWRICIAVGNQYNTIHPKKMYWPYQLAQY
jgi:hypothetical protein